MHKNCSTTDTTPSRQRSRHAWILAGALGALVSCDQDQDSARQAREAVAIQPEPPRPTYEGPPITGYFGGVQCLDLPDAARSALFPGPDPQTVRLTQAVAEEDGALRWDLLYMNNDNPETKVLPTNVGPAPVLVPGTGERIAFLRNLDPDELGHWLRTAAFLESFHGAASLKLASAARARRTALFLGTLDGTDQVEQLTDGSSHISFAAGGDAIYYTLQSSWAGNGEVYRYPLDANPPRAEAPGEPDGGATRTPGGATEATASAVQAGNSGSATSKALKNGRASRVWAVMDGGKSLLISARTLRGVFEQDLLRLPLDGGNAERIGNREVAVEYHAVGDEILFNRKGGGVGTLPLGTSGSAASSSATSAEAAPARAADAGPGGADAGATPDAGSEARDFIHRRGHEYFLERKHEHRASYARYDATAKLEALDDPFITLEGTTVWSMLEIRPGVIVALVSHDTDGSGDASPLDEKDICLFQRTAEPITLQTRDVPEAFVVVKHMLAAVLEAPDLRDGRIRIGAGGRAVRIESPGTGPDSIEALRERVGALRAEIHTILGNDEISVAIDYEAGERGAASVWDHEQKRFFTQVRWYDVVLDDRSEHTVAMDAKVTEILEYGFIREAVVCSGTITNMSDAPLDVEVACEADPWLAAQSQVEPLRKTTKLGQPIPPGGKHKYRVRVGNADSLKYGKFRTTVLVAGQPIAPFSEFQEAEGRHWLETLAALEAQTGFRFRRADTSGHRFGLTLFAPRGFPEMEAKRRNALSAQAFKLLRPHYDEFHRTAAFDSIQVYDHGSKSDEPDWTVTRRGAKPARP